MDTKEHWSTVYSTKLSTEVSWFQEKPTLSLNLIKRVTPEAGLRIIDVGGGASNLIDHMLAQGCREATVLDISSEALDVSKKRLGEKAAGVTWMIADITNAPLPSDAYNVWHDRAVFHFLTDPEARQKYISQLRRSLETSGHLVMATFAADGPERCSGLNVMRYSADMLAKELGNGFRLINTVGETHETPFETKQKFLYCVFKKV